MASSSGCTPAGCCGWWYQRRAKKIATRQSPYRDGGAFGQKWNQLAHREDDKHWGNVHSTAVFQKFSNSNLVDVNWLVSFWIVSLYSKAFLRYSTRVGHLPSMFFKGMHCKGKQPKCIYLFIFTKFTSTPLNKKYLSPPLTLVCTENAETVSKPVSWPVTNIIVTTQTLSPFR